MNSSPFWLEKMAARYPWILLLSTFIFVAALSGGMFKLQVDTSVERILTPDHPFMQGLEEFKRNFINDKKIIIGIEDPALLEKEGKEFLKDLAHTIAALPEVEKVLGLPNLKVPNAQGSKALSFKPALDIDPSLLSSHPLLGGTFISNDCTATVLQLYPKGEWQRDFPDRLLSMLENPSRNGVRLYVGGTPFLERELINSIFHDLILLTPLVAGLLFVLLFFLWRELFSTILCLGVVLLTLGASLGIMGWSNTPITMLTTVLPPLLLATGMATAIHILSAVRRSGSTTLAQVLGQVFRPCLFACLTTAAGFGSLILNPVIHVKEFGLFSMAGILLSFLVSFGIILPLVQIRGMKNRDRTSYSLMGLLVRVLHNFADRYLHAVNILFTGLLCGFLFLTPFIHINLSVFDNLDPKGKVFQGYQFFQEKLSGVSTLELELYSKGGEILKPNTLDAMLKLSSVLKEDPRVNGVISVAHFLSYLESLVSGGGGILPPSPSASDQLLFLYRLAGYGLVFDDYITEERDRARFSVLIGNMTAAEFSSLAEKVKKLCINLFPPPLSFRITGSVELYSQINRFLFGGLIKSLLTAFILIGAFVLLFLRSWKLGLLMFFPNVFPLAITYGSMYLMGLSMDIQAAMVGCISLGISVDGTIHLLYNYRLNQDLCPREKIRHTWFTIGKPVLAAALALIMVFSILSLSSFRPTRIFGFLCALALFSALAGDLIYLPALLRGPFRERKSK